MVATVRSPRERGKLKRASTSGSGTKKEHAKTKTKTIRRVSFASLPPTTLSPPPGPWLTRRFAGSSSQIRVWWPPTTNKKRSNHSGMFWPAKMTEAVGTEKAMVEYDNGDVGTELVKNFQPEHAPVEFGEEKKGFKVGEYCEVSNSSKSDPAAWFGKIVKVNKATCTVTYPFCDSSEENKKHELLRRARIFVEKSKEWRYVDPRQKWKDGKFESPMEAKLVHKSVFDKWLSEPVEEPATEKKAPASSSRASGKLSVKEAKIAKKRYDSAIADQFPTIKKPVRAKTAYLFFCEAKRPAVRKSNPGLSMVEVTKVLGEQWKGLTGEQRKPFEAQASRDQKRHAAENDRYLSELKAQPSVNLQIPPQGFPPAMFGQNVFGMIPQVGACQEKLRKPTIPKTAKTLYESSQRKLLKQDYNKEEAGLRWEGLSKDERAPFEEKAAGLKAAYEVKMREYQAKKKFRGGQHGGFAAMPMAAQNAHPMLFSGVPTQSSQAVGPPGGAHLMQNVPPLLTPTQLIDMDDLKKRIKKTCTTAGKSPPPRCPYHF